MRKITRYCHGTSNSGLWSRCVFFMSFRAERSEVEKSVIFILRERISPLAFGSVEMTDIKVTER